MLIRGIHRQRSAAVERAVTDDPWHRVRLGGMALVVVTVVGSAGYWLIGLNPLQAVYMTVVTISTVGFRELANDPSQVDGVYQVWTLLLIVVGVGTALYTLSVTLETILERQMTDLRRRRMMDREIEKIQGHTIVCGYGRLGRTIAGHLQAADRPLVVIDRDIERVARTSLLHVVGDGTDDDVLRSAGIERAATFIAATDSDSDNLYLTLSARTLHPDLFIVARAKIETAEPKLLQAGADRVVNPQLIGGQRIAALTLQPHVAEFLDVVMHDESLEFRLEEVPVAAASSLVGQTLRDSHVRDQTGAMVLAIRSLEGEFLTNPPPTSTITGGSTLIAIGTGDQLAALTAAASDD